MKMKNYGLGLFFMLLLWSPAIAQLTIEAEVRPRFEYRHGFGTLFPDNADASAFISQRTRLYSSFSKDYLKLYLSIQDIRVWGDVPQLNRADRNGLGLFQAWGAVVFSPSVTLKLGRQALDLDDQRIFGSVAWAQQARSHDMALFTYHKNDSKLLAGAAFNQDGESNLGNVLTTENTYKSLQFLWFHQDWSALSASFLFLNNGLQFIDDLIPDNNETRFSQTIGAHLKSNKQLFSWWTNVYYQFGKDVDDNDISAYLLALEASYKSGPNWSLILGGELISGNDNGLPDNGENKAFNPFYGTNHKFNGLMDYFFVGNHANNVGLLDVYLGSVIGLGEKASIYARVHNFSAAADLQNSDSKQLGVEADFVLNYNFKKDINIQAGYSHLFASDGMEVLKNNFDGNVNYWGWAMVTIKPTLFQTKTD
ncbi:alginate export family protein [Poritiphilus flavus]|uniref:Alginate export family protein n=1 Tax=Poritiphilus flavus TaxID=2697053 RepID=A0A6L9EG74_9FLAO|nr:alginate export family protein [Poritiphilus flavus]NAS13656.1 alginate export family protein [Poritiphilus flavus]